ncbi:MAG: M23 family metallopeptidase, partial [Chitinophagia bacterium]|nr:M23 family metallopeptidase [Chitinophagia bacterium]
MGFSAVAQLPNRLPVYPQQYFRNPLDIPALLAGNFGECRPNHFHSGIDIKTKGEENYPVFAAADGYVSRIKMESGGFGHGLYITHPNGYTTLYAHLNDFAPAIQQYVHRLQYEKKSWAIDVDLPATMFPVKQGQLIAYSGNTGGSTAPHLHFEIRDTKTEHPLNPLLFGLPVADHKPPVLKQVAFYQGSVYETSPTLVPLKSTAGGYLPVKTIRRRPVVYDTVLLPAGNTRIAFNADDYMDESDNQLTFLTADLLIDDSPQVKLTLNDIGYDESRYINAYVDYKTKKQRGPWLQCFFQLPGNHLDRIYQFANAGRGNIQLQSGSTHKVTIILTDCSGNSCKSVCYIKATNAVAAPKANALGTPFLAGRNNELNDNNISFVLDDKQLYDNINFVYMHTRPEAGGYSERYQLHNA